MKKALIYIHGKGGNVGESSHYAPLFPEYEILGFDYHAETPWEAKAEFEHYFAACAKQYDAFSIVANSIGAYFLLHTMDAMGDSSVCALPEAVYLISPVVDMEHLISSMMLWAGVDEARLRTEKEIPTDFGEVLSWEYLSYVKEHPIRMNNGCVPTAVLWGSSDNLVPEDVIRGLAKCSGAELTIYPGGEHWFHTEEQMAFLDRWITGFRAKVTVSE
ncbi:MAG: alpha/beta hydrolase [Clostridia bacterium]|nr:alpha/beta hydrolase [Clostridia bacterium]